MQMQRLSVYAAPKIFWRLPEVSYIAICSTRLDSARISAGQGHINSEYVSPQTPDILSSAEDLEKLLV